jgi:superfamily II DNA or RNA helicase
MNKTILSKDGYIIPKIDKFKLFINNCKEDLTVEPYISYSISKNIKNQKSNKFKVFYETNNYISIPKYYGLEKLGLPDINNETEGIKINISFNGHLRIKQNEIINEIIPHIISKNGGILCLPCAAGKTVLALYLISYFKVKALVIVHKTFLLEQWKERALEFTNAKIGIIKQNKIDVENKDIVIGMLQSIAKKKYDDNIFKDFGIVILDEAHHIPSQYFSNALPLITCKLTIGLSATPKRNDKLEKILFWYFGNIMYKLENEENNNVLVNIINYSIEHPKFKEIKMYTGDFNRPGTINKLISIGRRNKFIINMIENVLNNFNFENKRKIIVLSDRIEHLKLLKKRLDEKNITNSDFYIGGMKQNALKISEKAQIIFASYSMASEALDIPELNTLFMVTSRSEVEQTVGRILRKIDLNLRPIIYDFVDQLPSFINQSKKRNKLYYKMGFAINNINVIDNKIINEELLHNNNKNNEECEFIDNCDNDDVFID